MPVPPMAPSPLAFAATLGGHVLVWKTAFLVRVSLPQEYVAQREIPHHCWVSVVFPVPSGLWDRSGGLNYKVSLLPVSPAQALQIRGVGPSFPYVLQHSTAGTERGAVIRLFVMPLAMDSSPCYPEIPQTFCLSRFPGILVLMRDIFQFFVFH